MKVAILFLPLLLLACASRPFEDWSRQDTYRQVAYTTLHVIDWMQTLEAVEDDNFCEHNPILGENPSSRSVDLYMGTALILQTLIPGMLEPKYRKYWQYVWIGLEAGTVVKNYHIGVRF